MKAKESKLLKFLQGEKQFHVPIYQRTYSWQRPQCEQFWHDLLMAGRDGKVEAHFLGAVVYIGRGLHQVTDVSQYLVIDGQQRLTTTSLLLLALAQHLGSDGEIVLASEAEDGSVTETKITAARLRENFLINKHEDGGDGFYKLLLTQSDRETLRRLLNGGPLPEKLSSRVTENLAFFADRLNDQGVDLRDVYRGLQKLVVVDVALEQGRDNPQLIFESMNSTGLDLTQADLIRNFMLMGLEPKAQTKLYNDYWKPMEDRFAGRKPEDFDRFVRDYLSLRVPTSTPARLDQVYAAFKRYAVAHKDMVALVQDLAEMAGHYAVILDPASAEQDADVRRALLDMGALKLDVVFPFLLQVYADWQRGLIDRPEMLRVLRLTESYLFRRSVAGVNSQGLNKFFPDLPRRLNPLNYVQSLQDALFDLKSYLRFPRDGEFREALMHRDLYQVKRLCGYTLLKLENHDHKEPIPLGGLTIEHVMPQTPNLSAEWLSMLGPDAEDVQSRYLHTLGNLTLTGYNSELSARPFLEKRDIKGGFWDSHLRLNADLAELDEWNEAQIRARAERLADLAVKVWPTLEPSEEAKAKADEKAHKVQKVERSVEDHLLGASTELRELFEDVREGLLSLHEDATEHPLAVYVGYKVGTNFCDITVQPGVNTLRCWLNMTYGALLDQTGRPRDVSEIGHHGNGDVEVVLRPGDDVEWFLGLAGQALAHQMAKAPQGGSSAALNLNALSGPAAEALAAFEQALRGLDAALTRRLNKTYLGYGDPVVVAGLVREGGLVLEVQPRDPDLLPAHMLTGWESRSQERWGYRLSAPADVPGAMALVQAVHAQVAQGMAYREPAVRALVRAIKDAFTAQGASVKSSKSAHHYLLGERDVGRLWINRGDVELAIRHPHTAFSNPQGLGQAKASRGLAGWEPGYFEGRFDRASDVPALVSLIAEAVKANRAPL